jgi:hypothetical protein
MSGGLCSECYNLAVKYYTFILYMIANVLIIANGPKLNEMYSYSSTILQVLSLALLFCAMRYRNITVFRSNANHK